MSYNVAFVGTRAAGGFEGVVTWTSFPSKEDFETRKREWIEEDKPKKRVLEEGISAERCVELVKQTPVACYVAAAVQCATNSDGIIDPVRLQHEILKVSVITAE